MKSRSDVIVPARPSTCRIGLRLAADRRLGFATSEVEILALRLVCPCVLCREERAREVAPKLARGEP